MSTLRGKIPARIKLELQKFYFSHFNKYEKVVWLIGSGRSGTTWISNLINFDSSYRELFEPFHHGFIPEMKFLSFHEYLRPGSKNKKLSRVGKSVFSGKIGHRRIDIKNGNFNYNKLLVKDINANLFAAQLLKENQNVIPIFLIRNPFAVAHSIYEKKNWQWMINPADFLKQPDLTEDYLKPFEELIIKVSESEDYIIKQILIWCIINYVPLKQLNPDDLCVIFYEDVLENPNTEMTRVHQFVYPSDKSVVDIPETTIHTPSKVSVHRDSFKHSRWHEHLSSTQLEAGMSILKQFGLDKLYDSNFAPNHSGLQEFQNT